ncbi:MAG: glycoside hydrolase family protein [Phenylobacterium sp.]|uniref:glycoside hydrolase family protein n=1 Tax=Phenylobacterium sp. TaxID=1871053 RepID=UPI001A23847A|nr:glycoside hydrolase family protein [Phenylobacterium sp.]MBJ7410111.1 glycoside hydrolase family protein [Phenylobacterium sp.]
MSREALEAIRADAKAARDAINRVLARLDLVLSEAQVEDGIDPQLIADLKRDEGLRLDAYPDPISKGPPWTIGYGHTGPEVRPGLTWTREEADAALRDDIAKHNAELARHLPWIARLDPARRRVLQNMAFNLGIGEPGGKKGLLGFKNTLAMIERGDYAAAADGMLRSLWARQVGQRAVRLANTMRTGT